MPRITALYAWVVADTDADDEGVPAFTDPSTGFWMPLMGADIQRAESVRYMAQKIANGSGKPLKLIRSTAIEVVDEVTPEEEQ